MDDLTDEVRRNLEAKYVKRTYDKIAEDFSSTRYKKWPKVDTFLNSLSTTSLLLDVGCGNGKYLNNNLNFSIGCDTSKNLLSICKARGYEVVLCDMTLLPFRKECFDSIICIAALHHVVSEDRRRKTIEGMVDLLQYQTSKLLLQVWSFEQNLCSKNTYLSSSTPQSSQTVPEREISLDETTKIPVHKNRTSFKNQDVLVPFKIKVKADEDALKTSEELRYYHLFRAGELESLVNQVNSAQVIDSYHDQGNWCAVIQRR